MGQFQVIDLELSLECGHSCPGLFVIGPLSILVGCPAMLFFDPHLQAQPVGPCAHTVLRTMIYLGATLTVIGAYF